MFDQIARNKRRTFLLLAIFVVLVAAVAIGLGYLFRAGTWFVPVAIVIAIAMAWGSYFSSDRIALAASRARPADPTEYARYHNLVEGSASRRACRSPASTSSTTRLPTPSPPVATRSTPRWP